MTVRVSQDTHKKTLYYILYSPQKKRKSYTNERMTDTVHSNIQKTTLKTDINDLTSNVNT